MYAVRLAAAALAATAAVVSAAPAPAQASADDVTWTVRTGSNSYGDDRSSFSYNVNPGGTAKDAMVVANRGRTPLTLGVYTADGFTTEAGGLDLRANAAKQTGIGAWVSPGATTVVVQPGKTASVPFTVSVPANATPGDYAGGIVTSLTQPSNDPGINVERRLGIRIKLRVGGELAPALSIEDLRVSWSGTVTGDATITYTIHNTGNAILSAQQTAAVSGPFGWFKTPATPVPGSPAAASGSAGPQASPSLLPGEKWKVSVPVDDVAPYFWLTGTATLTPLLTDASGSTTSLTPVTATTHGWAVSWLLLLAALAVVALLALTIRSRKRRKQREDARVRDAVASALREKELSA